MLNLPLAQHVYIGAHLDDIILSCAGTIAKQVEEGEAVAAVTVFAGSPEEEVNTSLVSDLHERWHEAFDTDTSQIDINAVRRGEDILAFASISHQIEVEHYSLPDCIYRVDKTTGEPLYVTEDDIFGDIHPNDPALDELSAPPELSADIKLYIPLAVGNHVDHQLIRHCVESWSLPADNIRYYEDFPYVTGDGELEKVVDVDDGWEAVVTELNDTLLYIKTNAVLQYVSQISTFWQTPDELTDMLLAYNAKSGGERFWVR